MGRVASHASHLRMTEDPEVVASKLDNQHSAAILRCEPGGAQHRPGSLEG